MIITNNNDTSIYVRFGVVKDHSVSPEDFTTYSNWLKKQITSISRAELFGCVMTKDYWKPLLQRPRVTDLNDVGFIIPPGGLTLDPSGTFIKAKLNFLYQNVRVLGKVDRTNDSTAVGGRSELICVKDIVNHCQAIEAKLHLERVDNKEYYTPSFQPPNIFNYSIGELQLVGLDLVMG